MEKNLISEPTQGQAKATPTFTPMPTLTPTPIIINDAEHIVINCGEDLQIIGTLQKYSTLTLFKANGLPYYSTSNFIDGTLIGNINASSKIKGTNLRLQNNTLSKTSLCFVGFQNKGRYIGTLLPISQLLNGRKVNEPFKGSLLIQARGSEAHIEWLTYKHTSSSKKNCVIYRIIKNPYPCLQDCTSIETKSGCSCFCANFLYYDEDCIPTEINPNCICGCRENQIELAPTFEKK